MDVFFMRVGTTDHVVVDINQLPEAIQSILEEYSFETREKVSEAVSETAKESRKIVSDKAPQGRRKKYFKSIRVKTEEETFGRACTLYATNHEYSLTHLLEHGHKLWNRPSRPTRAFPHWKDGEQHAIEKKKKKIMKKLGG